MLKRFTGPRAGRPYSSAVRAGNLIHTAGYTGFDKEGRVPEDFAEQCRLIFEKARTNLELAGSSLAEVVSVTVYLTDQERDRDALDHVFRDFFADAPPARTTVEIKGLSSPEKRVEMQFVGYATKEVQE